MFFRKSLCLVVLSFGVPSLSNAHSGGTDKYGCHEVTKTKKYHCHKGPNEGQTFDSEADAKGQLTEKPQEDPAKPKKSKAK